MREGINKIFLILMLTCISVFYCFACGSPATNGAHTNIRIITIHTAKAADNQNIVINEIAWMGMGTSSNDEWIELRNIGDSEINLEGWTLVAQDKPLTINLASSVPAGGYFLLERTDDDSVPDITADLIYTGWLGNGGEVLRLLDELGDLVDVIDASKGWPFGDNGTKQTMERGDASGVWQNSELPGGTPRQPNSGGVPQEPESFCGDGVLNDGEDCDDGNQIDGDGCSADCQTEEQVATSTPEQDDEDDSGAEQGEDTNQAIKLGGIVINEFVSDPADGEVEWAELFNTIAEEIDLTGWIIEEGSGAKTVLAGVIGYSGTARFFVIEKPKGNLNNKGDIIILRDSKGVLIDRITYGNWDDGNMDDNASKADDPYSVARKFDGLNSYNNANDFIITTTPTRGASNLIILTEDEQESKSGVSNKEKAMYDYSDNIIISEIFPNPAGSDNEAEFIELFNGGERDVNLTGWRLGDESSKRYELSPPLLKLRGVKSKKDGDVEMGNNTVIKAKSFRVIYRSKSKIALNNGGDSVKLWQPLEDEPYQMVKYEKAVENWSYANLPTAINKKWQWTEIVTPGEENVIKNINHAPMVDFDCPEEMVIGVPAMFDSSDTVDEDGDELEFSWDFGDGIILTLPCPQHTYLRVGNYTVKLTVNDGENEVIEEGVVRVAAGYPDSWEALAAPITLGWEGVADSKIVINEFMPDPEGSDAEEWVELYNNGETKINLLNWRLDDGEGGSRPHNFTDDFWLNIGQYYIVEREESGIALNNSGDIARLFTEKGDLIDEVKYGKANEGEAYARGINGKWFWTTAATPGEKNIIAVADSMDSGYNMPVHSVNSAGKNDADKILITTTLEKIKEFDVGDLVQVRGRVAVLPGILGSQYFYIVGSPGIQVYNYKKDFPKLRVGDLVEVSGELAVSQSEKRIKTKAADDIVVIEHKEPPVPEEAKCDKINDDYIGRLITVSGEIVERKGVSLYLDDGTEEIKIYCKTTTGISAKRVKEGEVLAVTGLVGSTKSGLRLLPRSSDDLVRKDIESREAGQVLGEVAVSDEWAIAARNRKLELFQYLLVAAGAVIAVLGGLLVKMRRG